MQEQIKENRKELRESAAQSAALAGLFQPYSVGKFNATAAVGGYRDEQAIAVGVATVSQRMWQEKLQLLQVGHPHRGMLV